MKKATKKVLCLALALMLAVSLCLTGCQKEEPDDKAETQQTTTQAAEKPVELVWVTRSSPQEETDVVEKELNQKLLPAINATVKLNYIDPGTYNDKIKVKMAAQEVMDLVFTAPWANDYYGNVAKGAFTALDGLLAEYAPKSYAQIPEAFWDAVKVDGKIYGFINYQICSRNAAFAAIKEYVEKYNFDMSKIKKPQDVEPFLAAIKAGEDSSIIPTEGWKNGAWEIIMTYYDFEQVGSVFSPGVIRVKNNDLRVINQYATDEFKEHALMMRDWYQKGYMIKDAATFTSLVQQRSTKKCVSLFMTTKPGGLAEWQGQYGYEMAAQQIAEPMVSTTAVTTTMNAIPITSSDPVRTMKLLELVNSDPEISNLINFGIEGRHYTKVGDNRIEKIADSKYWPNRSWTFGNVFITYLQPGQEDDVWQKTKEMNESAFVSPLMGFNLDPEPIKSELAQCQAVFDEYAPGLLTGSVDPERYLPEFIEKLKTAGVDRIIQEEQAQIDAWKK
jgi:putative aldouronate transport system substrate-binding protein